MYKDLNLKGRTSDGERVWDVTEDNDLSAIGNSITNILTTRIGSVPGRPTFGSNLYLLVFEQLDYMTERLAKRYVREALEKFEDRIIINNVSTEVSEAFNRLIIKINFRYRDDIRADETVSVSFNL